MQIQNSTIADLDQILTLYQDARNKQISKQVVVWPIFEKTLVETEIAEKRQWKIVMNGITACVWATTFTDPEIWEERNNDPSVYIHRIATNPFFSGQNMVVEIIKWAKNYALKNQKDYIRLDTVAENTGLIGYYQKCGFDFLGLCKLTHTDKLPAHYHHATVSLFQIKIDKHDTSSYK